MKLFFFFGLVLMALHLPVSAEPSPVVIDFFYQTGCVDCSRVKNELLPQLNERYEGFFVLNGYDVNAVSNVAKLVAYQEALQINENESVMMVVDYQHVFNGFEAISTGLLDRVDQCVGERLASGWHEPKPLDAAENPLPIKLIPYVIPKLNLSESALILSVSPLLISFCAVRQFPTSGGCLFSSAE